MPESVRVISGSIRGRLVAGAGLGIACVVYYEFLFMFCFLEAKAVERQQTLLSVAILIIAFDLWRLYCDIKPGTVFFVLFSG